VSTSSPRLVDDSTVDEWTSTMPTPPAIAAVRSAGRKYARAVRARDEALAELQEAIRAAGEAGHSPTNEIIPAAGVARQTVFDALKKPRTAPAPAPEDRPEIVSYP
jgi:hypothetical protein